MQKYISSFILITLVLFISETTQSQNYGDYRSISSGVWTDTSHWEVYDGAAWVPATTYPTIGSNAITISDSISLESNMQIDQLTVVSGGKLAINLNSIVTLQNGDGTDLTLDGELFLNGHLTFNNSTTVGGSGTLTNNDTLYVFDGITISCNIFNNGLYLFNGISSFNGVLTTTSNSIVSIVSGANHRYGYITFARGFTNHGLLSMVGYNDAWGNPIPAILTLNSDSLLNAPDGTIETLVGQGADRVITGPLINEGTINIGYVFTLNKASVHHRNNGTINVNGPAMYVYGDSASFTNNGAITIAASNFLEVKNGCAFVLSNGTISGLVKMSNTTLGSGTISNTASFRVHNVLSLADVVIHHYGSLLIYGYFTVNGILNSYTGSSIRIESGSLNDTGVLTLVHGLTNNGLIEMTAYLDAWGNPRPPYLRSDSVITNAPSGIIRTEQGAGQWRYIEAPFDNQGMMELNYGIVFNKSEMNHTNSGTILLNGGAIDIGANNTLSNTGIIDCGQQLITGGGNFLHLAGGTLKLGSPQGIRASGTTGNVQVGGTRTFDTDAHYIYSGVVPQVPGNGLPNPVSKLTIANDSGVTISGNIEITDSLMLEKGIIHTGTDTVFLPASGALRRDSGWIVGNLNKTFGGVGTKLFEVGTTNGYSPINVSVTSGSGSLTAKAIQGFHPNDSSNSLARYWNISASGMTANLSFFYLDGDVVGSDSNYAICKYDTAWTFLDGTVDSDFNTATINNVSSFSDWTLIKKNELPFGFVSFSGTQLSSYYVKLNWTTTHEKNNQGFYVERKSDEGEFTIVSNLIPGAGTTQEPQQYFWIDSTLTDSGNYYYRLKQVSQNGVSTFSYDIEISVIIATMQFSLSDGWNMLSVPLTVFNFAKTALYPTAVSAAFAYDNGYSIEDTLLNGVGYWVKFSGSQQVTMSGFYREEDFFTVRAGWNMIGSISFPVDVSTITSNPPGLVTSQFFGYDNGYTPATQIEPGKAYWVKVNQEGELILSSMVNSHLSLGKIRIIASDELPPPPPESEIRNQKSEIPDEFALLQNYPNPFNPLTVIRYQLPVDSWVTLKVYNVLGEEVAILGDGLQVAGYKFVEWDATGFPSGMYYYRFQAENYSDIKKLILIK
ncbi:MAG: T9SS type A sorting domain-containing protein [Ignavibacteriae bacterium]|nr:T9SS type A sorting domain-containing protein [Ignavibacteriota bacterium]